MSILDKALSMIGYAPLARGLAVEVLKSPWSDDSALTDWTLADVFGTMPYGLPMNRTKAMRIATVAKARNQVATTIGRLPLYTQKGGARAPIQNPMLAQPEHGRPLSTTLTWTVDALMFYPTTWWHVIERDSYGWPLWVEWIDRGRATLDAFGKLVAIDNEAVQDRDVIQFDSPLGTGLLDIARDTLNRAIAINVAAASAEDNPVPTIELHNESSDTLTEDEIVALVDAWRSARRKGGVAYTPKSITAKASGQQPQQLLIEGRKAIALELVRHLNVPAWVCDVQLDGSSLTYENRQDRNAELIDGALAPYMSAIRDRLSMGDVTPRGWRVLFDTDELTKPDQKTRFETYNLGIVGGYVDTAKVAEWEGWETTTGVTP